MSTLYLLTNEFPYGNIEPYLETEVKYYNSFEKTVVFSLQVRKKHMAIIRKIPDNIDVVPILKASNLTYFFYAIKALLDCNLYKEFMRLLISKRLSLSNISRMFVYFSRSHYEADMISKRYSSPDINGDAIFYSYRFEYQPYVALLIKNKWKMDAKIISRAHGYDLYEERNTGRYIPMREGLLKLIDCVYPCSANGTDYLYSKYPKYIRKIETRYLGTIDYGEKEYFPEKFRYEIVTCSNVIPLKRLDLLIEALAMIQDIKIKWVHYGDGVSMDQVRLLAQKKLNNNIEYSFKGHLANKDLIKEYRNNNFYLFINVSSDEGLPVSIMEAMSFGIPCIATDVGGTNEIIDSGKNGKLLLPDPTAKQVADCIINFCKMDIEEYHKYRTASRQKWISMFNANINYEKFVKELSSFK